MEKYWSSENVIWYDKAFGPSGYRQVTQDLHTSPWHKQSVHNFQTLQLSLNSICERDSHFLQGLSDI